MLRRPSDAAPGRRVSAEREADVAKLQAAPTTTARLSELKGATAGTEFF